MSGGGRLTILILGGYGTFGGRLAQLLADETRLTLIVAGRSLERAEDFRRSLQGAATIRAARLDRTALAASDFAALAPDLVVDASGPFQVYGDRPYRAVEACLEAGIPYLDLADGRDFVAGIAAYDADAKARGVFVLSGASSFPVLTGAVVEALSEALAALDSVEAGIAPSPYASVGLNVIRAIAAYAGKPVPRRLDGQEATGYGLTEARLRTIAPPGRLPLRATRFSLVDVPDLALLPARWPGLRDVWAGAGPVPEIWHRALNGLAWLVRWRVLPTLAPAAPLFERAVNWLRWGEHRGGMYVTVAGRNRAGTSVRRGWHLLAEGTGGPLIPSMAAEAIVRAMLDGRRPEPGARSALGAVTLAEYQALFRARGIATGIWPEPDPGAPLYRQALGPAFATLPGPVRALHDQLGPRTYRGLAEVERGTSWLAHAIAAMIGFPAAGRDVPVTVRFTVRDGVERWERDFAGRRFVSTQEMGRGRWERLVVERFGPVAVGLALVVEGDSLRVVVRRWSIFGLVLPLWLAPGGDTHETADGEDFRFHVTIATPLAGLVVRYRGWLRPEVGA